MPKTANSLHHQSQLRRKLRLSWLFLCLTFILPNTGHARPTNDGEWHLTISGSNLFFFGTRMLTAGLHQDWTIDIEFHIKNGQFDIASGTGMLVGKPTPYSKPEKMFQCAITEGTYLDRGLNIVSTPHMRYEGFPVAGKVVDEQILLEPGVEYIGNFIAMMYECSTTNTLADVWLERGRLSAQERAKRLGYVIRKENKTTSVKVKEVQAMEPRGTIQLPLKDGYQFKLTDQASMSTVNYSLSRK